MKKMKKDKTRRTRFTILNAMKPVEHLSKGSIIQMVRTGKEFIVDKITPTGVVLRECTTFVSFSKSALNERLKRKSAIIIQH